MKTFNTLRVIFALVGVGLLVAAFFSFQSTSTFLENATATPDIVTDLIRSRSPLISRFKLGQRTEGKAKNKTPDLRLGIQELEYTHSTMQTGVGQVDDFNLTRNTPLKRITGWVPVPEDHAVHFLVERNLTGGETNAFNHNERRTISLRMVLQACIESEVGYFRIPMPVLDDYQPFDAARHGVLPDKERQAFNPFNNEPVPYWIVKEVAV
ncbi:hypothetical protein [Marinobacter subterrani]|uniref:Uncharacterized protein n=1 Tax=Marinobacter subterrani TaxID=1658765 RepID=A0A0J7JB21_9GAMM|nr:hypothetical protein [Marinobacter subterrani]KMQ75056.1 hypothetical protein Msub_11255 [Marinobacter subterrani]